METLIINRVREQKEIMTNIYREKTLPTGPIEKYRNFFFFNILKRIPESTMYYAYNILIQLHMRIKSMEGQQISHLIYLKLKE